MYNFSVEDHAIAEHAQNLIKELPPKQMFVTNVKEFMKRAMETLAIQGYLGLRIPADYGGEDLNMLSSMIVLAEIAQAHPSIAHVLGAHTFGFCNCVINYGTDAQKDIYLRKFRQKAKLGTLAFTEPGGHNLDSQAMSATKVDDGFVLNGTKSMITCAKEADAALVFVKTGQEEELEKNFSFFIVDLKDSEGIEFGKVEATMGMEGAQIADIYFSDCKVPEDRLVGEEGQGLEIIVNSTIGTRIANAAVALGISEAAYKQAVKFAAQRLLFGRPLVTHTHANFELADIFSKLETIKLLTYHSASLCDDGGSRMFINAAICKYQVTEIAKEICDKALQIHGGYGYIRDSMIEQLYRDIRVHTLIGGSSEVLKSTIGKTISNACGDK